MLKEFAKFLKEFNVFALAVAFIMGTASTTLVNSLVKDILMPIAAPLMSAESWNEATASIGPVKIAYGSFLAEFINFIILAAIIFVIAKKILKIEKEEKK
ncbi:MAG: MscL family protein [Patescibacteria group bacterium]|nr:MscL family protein [Patescibacteria group bacterium]MDE2015665.1 MscL family protein [Patescibacteria group bacterium]MDE2226722.1 MscL family protein [Patescibacteria group bacterium]